MVNNKTDHNNFDLTLSEKILSRINQGSASETKIKVREIPSFENKSIINMSENRFTRIFNLKTAQNCLKHFTDRVDLEDYGIREGENITLSRGELEKIGLYLLPLVSGGILNGGAATSYTDSLKNSSFNSSLFDSCRKEFEVLRSLYKNSPKGITPAYINSSNSHGASFIELKMRSFLLKIEQYKNKIADEEFLYPLFQMTSMQTDRALSDAYKKYKNSSYLKDLINRTETDITSVLTEIQPLTAAFTHSSEGFPRKIFKNEDNEMLLLPGGHGQNFAVLKDIYKKLLKSGKKFVYLGNVDNIGFNIDLCEVAILALTGSEAGFDFAVKTPVDVKGGVLVIDESGKLNCGDIGASVSKEQISEAEKQGKSILFNCATGLFNLEFLVRNIDRIIDSLPLRISDQEKESGRYSQAEQISWEVISLLDDFIIFGVNKYKRFLSSKLLMENMLISRPECCCSYFREHSESSFNKISENLNRGLTEILSDEMQMENKNNIWRPVLNNSGSSV